MQGKGLVKFFLILLTFVCLWQFHFLIPTNRVESEADRYAKEAAAKAAPENKDVAYKFARAQFLDSMSSEVCYSIPLLKKYTYEDLKKQQLALGLDLKGGMSVFLQVDLREFLTTLSDNSKDPEFLKALDNATLRQKDAQTDYITLFVQEYEKIASGKKIAQIFYRNKSLKDRINFNSSNSEVQRLLREKANETVGITFNRLKKRIDELGVVQPNVQLDEARDIIVVELPGIDNPQRARNFLQATAKLEFWDVYRNNDPGLLQAFQEADKKLKSAGAGLTVDTTAATQDTSAVTATNPQDTSKTKTAAADTTKKAPTASVQGPLLSILSVSPANGSAVMATADKNKMGLISEYLARPGIKALFPRDLIFRWSREASKDQTGKETSQYELYALKSSRGKGPALEGDHVTDASANPDPQSGDIKVSLKMDNTGAKIWGQMTTKAAQDRNREIAIVLDEKVVSAPRVINPILTGDSQIEGGYTVQTAKDLASILQIGKLPAKTQIIQESLVGPSLGQENINASLMSLIIAFIAVVVFMAIYYSTGGIIAIIALLVNLFFIIGALTSYGTVLTLPGMAGIVLTMGMAVDANVIIYERIREELHLGKTKLLAIREGFQHSMSAIIDGNLTTMIVGLVLIYFGLGPIKGFGVVLTIGIIFTLFTAILISRLIIEWWMARGNDIRFFAPWSEFAFKNIHLDWMGMRKKAYIFSSSVVLLGVISFFIRGFELGVDFKGGHSYNIQFDKSVSTDEVRNALTKSFAGASTIVKSVSTNNTLNVTTSYLVGDQGQDSEDRVMAKLFEGINAVENGKLSEEEFKKPDSKVTHITSFTKIGPTVAEDIKKSSIWATIAGLILISLYILLRFNRWQYSIGAVFATLHDVFFPLTAFTLLHGIIPFSLEIDQSIIAAILTLIGYSINDTVIVYDRIREYMLQYTKKPMGEVINDAINSTLSRTIITSSTVLLVLIVLFFFGGSSIRGFSFAMLIGVLSGTYSSIFIASPIMMDLSKNLDLSEKPSAGGVGTHKSKSSAKAK